MAPTRWLWAIVAVAAALRLFPVWFGLPYPYARPDEAQAISGAVGILRGDFNPHFFHWPSLTFYLFAAALGGVSAVRSMLGVDPLPMAVAVVTARIVVAMAGAATTVALFRLTRRIAGDTAALIAAAFLAVAPLHVRDSHFAMTDVLMTFLSTASLAALVAAFDRAADGTLASLRPFAVAGLIAGLATSTKYNAAVVLAAMGAAQALLLGHPGGPWSWTSRRWRAFAPGLAYIVAMLAGFVLGTPFAILDFRTFAADFTYDLTHLSGGHAVPMGRGWTAHLTRSLPYGCGLVMLLMAGLGLWLGTRRHTRHTVILASFSFAYYAILGSGQTVFFRYVLPLVPIVCLFAAAAVAHASETFASASPLPPGSARRRAAEKVMLAALVLFAIRWPAVTSLEIDLVLTRTDTRVLAAEWLGPRLRPEHTLHDAGSDYTRLDLRTRRYHEWHYNPQSRSFGHPEGLTPDWIVISESPLRHYASPDPALRRLVDQHYDLVHTVRGTTTLDTVAVYDQQDAFFVPFAGFRDVERPGPTVSVYRRR